MTTGTLYIVPTPIGNLNEMTPRAIETLSNADFVACEDTRHSLRLLQHFSIDAKTISLHQHNEQQRSQWVIDKLNEGCNIALVSDAGTPLISDPGFVLVRACREANLNVVALSGSCALTTALSGAGLPTDKFLFAGFLPVKQQAKHQAVLSAIESGITQVFYESPRRVLDTLEIIHQIDPDTQVVIAKELTKSFETYVGYTASSIIEWLNEDDKRLKGEFVLLLYRQKSENTDLSQEAINLAKTLSEHLPPKKAAAVAAEHYSANKKELYNLLVK